MMNELVVLHEQVSKARVNAMGEFKESQPFFVLFYSDLSFSSIQIDMLVPTTLGGGDDMVKVEDDETDDAPEGETVSLEVKEGGDPPNSDAPTA